MTNNIKKLTSYCLDCVKSTTKGNMKAEKIIIDNNNGLFNADNKEINDIMIKAKLNQSTMSLIYGFKWFIKENNTPLMYYTDIEIIREAEKIKILLDDDDLQINFNFLASLFDNDIEIVENITEQLTDLIDLKNINFEAVLMGLIGDKLTSYTIEHKNALMLVKMPENTAGLINELNQIIREY